MERGQRRNLIWVVGLVALMVVAALVVIISFLQQPAPPPAPTRVVQGQNPTSAVILPTLESATVLPPLPTGGQTAGPAGSPQPVRQAIIIESPAPGTVIGSPVVLAGRTSQFPFNGMLGFRASSSSGAQLGAGSFPVQGDVGGPSSFTASLNFNLPEGGGPVRFEIFDQSPNTGAVIATAAIDLVVAPPQPVAQQIVIETPPSGTQVGSPVVLTGRTTRFPFQGTLGYRVIGANGAQLGAGVFNVNGAPDGPATFNASLGFTLPPAGGPIRIEIFDQNAANGQVAATAAINLATASSLPPTQEPQRIAILTPPPGTEVGSPMVISGRVTRLPGGSALTYLVLDDTRRQLGAGTISINTPGEFNAEVRFNEPGTATRLLLELLDQDPTSGAVIASAAVNLQFQPPAQPEVVPPGQTITIETPAPGTVVGSPVVVTGRTTQAPTGNQLFYQVLDEAQNQIGLGTFDVISQPDGSARFNASMTFVEPQGGGPITVVVFDQNATGQVLARATLALQVVPPPPGQPTQPPVPTPTPPTLVPTQPILPPSPTQPSPVPPQSSPQVLPPAPTATQPLSPTTPLSPTIIIETPARGTQVGSPVVLTGRVVDLPLAGGLLYEVLDASGAKIGEGSITLEAQADGSGRFNASLTFTEPRAGGPIRIEIFRQEQEDGPKIASASITLNVAPYPAP